MFTFPMPLQTLQDPQIATPGLFVTGLAAITGFYLISKVYDRLAFKLAHYLYRPETETPGGIPDSLRRASEQGVRMDFALLRDGAATKSVPCRILNYSAEGVEIEAPDWMRSPQVLVGKSASCFFKVKAEQRELGEEHFQFESLVRGFRREHNGSTVIQLNPPLWFTRTQRRQHLRVSPPPKHFVDFSIWRIRSAEAPLDGLGRSSLAIRPESGRFYRIVNISAGGAMLVLDRRSFRTTGLSSEEGAQWLVRMVLSDPVKDRYVRVWAKAEVASCSSDRGRDLEIGLKFTAVSVHSQEVKEFQWREVDEEGIEPIEAWIFAVSLEYHRQGRDELIA